MICSLRGAPQAEGEIEVEEGIIRRQRIEEGERGERGCGAGGLAFQCSNYFLKKVQISKPYCEGE